MAKMKTNRGAAKRFRKSAGGQFRKKKSHARHILTKKSPKRKRLLRQPEMLSEHDQRQARRLLPYA